MQHWKLMSRRKRKLAFIRLKNRCNRTTANQGIPWYTDQKQFQFGSATVWVPSRNQQQCFCLTIMSHEYAKQVKLKKLSRLQQQDSMQVEQALQSLEKVITKDNIFAQIGEISLTRTGLVTTLITHYDQLDESKIGELIEYCYPSLCQKIKSEKSHSKN